MGPEPGKPARWPNRGRFSLAVVAAMAMVVMPSVPLLAQQPRFLTDRLELELVSEPDPAAEPTAPLAAGAELIVLEEADGWTRAQGPNGEVGWLPSALVVDDLAVQAELDSLEAEISRLSAESEAVTGLVERARGTVPWPWVAGAVIVALGLGFLCGYLWLDAAIRRKHGGFRVY